MSHRTVLTATCFASLLIGCTGGSGGPSHELVGECFAAPPALEITAPVTSIDPICRPDHNGIAVIEAAAQWDELFTGCAEVPPVPAVDFTRDHLLVAAVRCTPISLRFVAESSSEVVVGVLGETSGACLSNLLAVVPRSTKPARLAECRNECLDCPPVP